MAWVRPSRSRPNRPRPRRSGPGREGGVAGNSGGGGGSSLPGGGSAALGGGDTGLGRRRERGLQGISATSRLRSSHTPVAAGDSDPFPLHPLEAAQRGCIKGGAAVTDQRLLGASPANQCLQRAPKKLLVALGPALSTSMIRSARAMAGTRQGWRKPADNRRGGWLHRKGKSNGLNSGHGWLAWPCGG
jgi:hypothetical protein